MKKIIQLLILVLITSCAHNKKAATDQQIDQYCQDLNVLYQKKNIVESNIANIDTTRTAQGGHYKRKIVSSCKDGYCTIVEEDASPILKYMPKSPDANKQGYVAYPNYDVSLEKLELKHWYIVYNAVVKNAPVKSAFFLKDKRSDKCFEKYSFVDQYHNYRKYLGR